MSQIQVTSEDIQGNKIDNVKGFNREMGLVGKINIK